ncbi:MAG: Photosynthesis system assembly factor, partial [Planctomycetota bacterium]
NGGNTWTQAETQNDAFLYGIATNPMGGIWAVGGSGRILRSLDEGQSWSLASR